MIKINSIQYRCSSFKHSNIEGVEHLQIHIMGKFKDDRNKLHIDYNGVSYFGCKILPSYNLGETNFLVYIFKEGDSEL